MTTHRMNKPFMKHAQTQILLQNENDPMGSFLFPTSCSVHETQPPSSQPSSVHARYSHPGCDHPTMARGGPAAMGLIMCWSVEENRKEKRGLRLMQIFNANGYERPNERKSVCLYVQVSVYRQMCACGCVYTLMQRPEVSLGSQLLSASFFFFLRWGLTTQPQARLASDSEIFLLLSPKCQG